MPVNQVGQLLARWQQAGGVLSRGRVIADGMRLLNGLSPEERRVLAQALAEEGAPDLAQRIGAATGDRIDAGALHQTAAGLLGLEADQIRHLADTLSDHDERVRLARQAATHGFEGIADATGLELPGSASAQPSDASSRLPGGPPPPPGAAGRVGPASGYPTESLHALANGEVPLDDVELGDQMLDHPGLGEVHVSTIDVQEVDLDAPIRHDVGDQGGDPPTVSAAAADAGADAAADAAVQPEVDDGEDAGAVVPSGRAAQDERSEAAAASDAAVVTSTGRREDAAALLGRLRRARTAHERFAAVATSHLADLDAEVALRVLDAVPAGWQRRRVADRLAEAGALRGVAADELLRRFPRPADATFVAAAALHHGVLELDALHGRLPDPVVRRLAARSEA